MKLKRKAERWRRFTQFCNTFSLYRCYVFNVGCGECGAIFFIKKNNNIISRTKRIYWALEKNDELKQTAHTFQFTCDEQETIQSTTNSQPIEKKAERIHQRLFTSTFILCGEEEERKRIKIGTQRQASEGFVSMYFEHHMPRQTEWMNYCMIYRWNNENNSRRSMGNVL